VIITEPIGQRAGQRFVVQPNHSISWSDTVLIYIGILAVSVIVAGGFALLGLWMVLPFAGLEMILIAVVLYRCALRARFYEIIAIDDDHIWIERSCNRPGQPVSFQRYWARVQLVPPPRRNEASRLFVSSHGRREEIGTWLNEEEKKELAVDLSRLINTNETDSVKN
jgi:uncharacterized membrane protein